MIRSTAVTGGPAGAGAEAGATGGLRCTTSGRGVGVSGVSGSAAARSEVTAPPGSATAGGGGGAGSVRRGRGCAGACADLSTAAPQPARHAVAQQEAAGGEGDEHSGEHPGEDAARLLVGLAALPARLARVRGGGASGAGVALGR